MTAPIVFLDTETTSLGPDRQVWEVALIRRLGEMESTRHIQIGDVDLSYADPMALKVGGFYQRHFQYGTRESGIPRSVTPLAEQAAAKVIEEFTRGAHIVASNPAFDAGVLDAMLRRYNLIPAWSYHLIDVRAMALGWLSATATPGETFAPTVGTKSDILAAQCGIKVDDYDRHTALGDAQMVRDWYDAMVGA